MRDYFFTIVCENSRFFWRSLAEICNFLLRSVAEIREFLLQSLAKVRDCLPRSLAEIFDFFFVIICPFFFLRSFCWNSKFFSAIVYRNFVLSSAIPNWISRFSSLIFAEIHDFFFRDRFPKFPKFILRSFVKICDIFRDRSAILTILYRNHFTEFEINLCMKFTISLLNDICILHLFFAVFQGN